MALVCGALSSGVRPPVSAPQILRVSLAVIACAATLMLSAFYEDIFLPPWQTHELVETITASGEVAVGIADTFRIPPTIEVVLRIAIPLAALLGVAAYVGRLASSHKVWKGAVASMCAALIALAVLQIVTARRLDVSYVPSAITVAAWIAASLLIGAASAWALAVRWPNRSLERSHER